MFTTCGAAEVPCDVESLGRSSRWTQQYLREGLLSHEPNEFSPEKIARLLSRGSDRDNNPRARNGEHLPQGDEARGFELTQVMTKASLAQARESEKL